MPVSARAMHDHALAISHDGAPRGPLCNAAGKGARGQLAAPARGSPVLRLRHGVMYGGQPRAAAQRRALSNCSPSTRSSCAG
eukprot:640469-Pyramimonas_sp.AAC.1